MLDNYQHIAILISGFNNGTLTETEHDELDEWINAHENNHLLFKELSDPNRLREYLKLMEGYDEVGSWERIRKELPLTIIHLQHLFPWKKIAVAASIILTLGLGAYFAFFNKAKKEEIVILPETKDVEAPKLTKAMITLADGKKVALDSLTMITQGDVKLIKTQDGKIIYSPSTGGGQGEAMYNTLTNPRGSKVIDITLVDGSRVWLNAESSITYPTAFVGNERRVDITGEAYFEAAHNPAKPFIVKKNDVQVQVLGTHFNVNAYDDEASIKITLLEGSVKVMKGNATQLLTPGQQAQVTSDIKIVDGADIEAVMAWKNGYFHFGNTSLLDLMKQLGRWYDIDVEYQGNVPVREFGGEISRDANLSQVLKILNESKVKCRIEGKKLIVE